MVSINLSGKKIGKYKLYNFLGAGSMGAVYRGRKAGSKEDVAVKVLPPQLASEGNYQKRFMREAQTVARLSHYAIVPVYDYGVEGYFVCGDEISRRRVVGGSLAGGQRGPWPLALDFRSGVFGA